LSNKDFVYTGGENLEAVAYAKNYNKYLISIIENAAQGKAKKILDFGAGSGTYADMLKAKGIIVDCLEPDKRQQKILKKKGYKVAGDISELEPSSYDLIYSLNVFEHIEDDKQNFAKLNKVLKKNAVVVVYVPAFQSLFSSMDKLVGHYRRYRTGRLQAMAKDNNMKILKLQYCDPIGFAAALAFKASRNRSGVISIWSVKLYDTAAFPISRFLEPIFKQVVGKNALLVAQKNGK